MAISCSFHVPPEEAPTPIEILKPSAPLIPKRKEEPAIPELILSPEDLELFLNSIKTNIQEILSGEFQVNMAPQALSLSPAPSVFLDRLANTSPGQQCDYDELEAAIRQLGSWNSSWNAMLSYFTELLDEDPSHPDQATFPIIMHHLLLALEDPSLSNEGKIAALAEISSYGHSCKPTWAESTVRSINNLYSKRDTGQDQLLLWVQMFKENLLSEQQLILSTPKGRATENEWHQINGLKSIFGKQFGLMTDHLNSNLDKLTLRQALTNPQDRQQCMQLKQRFESVYAQSSTRLVKFVHDAFLASSPEIQTSITDYLLLTLKNLLNIPGRHYVDLALECFYDENCELTPQGMAYILYSLGILKPY